MTLASTDNRHLIMFARWPEQGQTKTRLIPALGAEGAARLARKLTEYTATQVRALACTATVHGTGASADAMAQWLSMPCILQISGDLGARMHAAIAQAHAGGSRRIILTGSDCPGLTSAILKDAFSALNSHDVVLGPAADGGYYLIGMRSPQPHLFDNMRWSHAQVLHDTLARLDGLRHHLLAVLHDIDTPDDLIHLPPDLMP
jgi:uncharacterized protein